MSARKPPKQVGLFDECEPHLFDGPLPKIDRRKFKDIVASVPLMERIKQWREGAAQRKRERERKQVAE